LSGATTSSLQVRIAAQRPAGTADAPGKNVRAKSGLNKSILDQGWYEFRRQLDYKLAWKGGRLIVVPPQNTSRTCPCCGHVSSDNRQTQAWFECVACGYENNADRGSGPEAFRGSGPEAFRGSGPEAFLVGAINILARGIQLLRDEGQDTADAAVGMRVGEPPVSARMACGSNCTGGRKQEPAETTAQGAIHA
jgi:putative transposase